MVPLYWRGETFAAYVYNHIQIENTFPDPKSRILCADVSTNLNMHGYGIILVVKGKGEKMKHPIFSPFPLLLPYIYLFTDSAALTTLLF
jgi:hypothetical protein